MPELINAERLAAITGLATSTLAKMRLRGTGPKYRKVGARVLYAIEDVESWLATRPTFTSTADYTTRRSS